MASSRRRGSSRAPVGPRRRVQVVVLGDFGRSPRMQYHALSLADQASLEVDVVAYTGSTPREEIVTHPHIHLRLIAPPPRGSAGACLASSLWRFASRRSSCSCSR